MHPRVAFALMLLAVLAARLAHSGIVWIEEGYPAAAALQLLNGSVLYRDIWFDKPPLAPYIYLLWGAHAGMIQRIAGALFIAFCAWLLYRLGRTLWSPREGLTAAALLAFYLTFGIPSAVMALAPDMLMIAPHIAAIWFAAAGRPFWSGALSGIALLTNSKGVFVLAACMLWNPAGGLWTLLGFAAPVGAHVVMLIWQGGLADYWMQVWQWGFIYSRHTFVDSPLVEGLTRTANWAGFHATIVVAAGIYWWRERKRESRKIAMWAAVSLIAVAAGWRFFPRYYFQLLPAVALAGSRGLALLPRKPVAALLLLLIIPFARFGPRYVQLAFGDTSWRDLSMSNDSREAANLVKSTARPSDTLFVWGYRPDLYPLTRLSAGTRFLDSQPLTGVLADRHLTDSTVLYPQLAERNRRRLALTQPTFIVDGLGPYNPTLAIANFADLHDWLLDYKMVARTRGAVIYRRVSPGENR